MVQEYTSDNMSGKAAVAQITHLLGTTWRLTITDDERVFTGRFVIVDRQVRNSDKIANCGEPGAERFVQKNVVLDEAVEEWLDGRQRNVGLIVIPGSRIKTAAVDRDTMAL